MLLRKNKWKQWDTITHLLERPKSATLTALTPANADKGVEQQERLPHDPATAFRGIYPEELKTMSTQTPAHKCLQKLYS